MKKIWHSKEISTDLNVRIFQTTCLSILLYGCEAWVLTKVMCKRLDSFVTSCYRYMLHIKRTDHERNETILKTVNQEPLSDTVQREIAKAAGANAAHEGRQHLTHVCNVRSQSWQRKRGRPATPLPQIHSPDDGDDRGRACASQLRMA